MANADADLQAAMQAYQDSAPQVPQTGAKVIPQPSLGAPPVPPQAPVVPPPKSQGILESLMSTVQNLGKNMASGMAATAPAQMEQIAEAPETAATVGAATLRSPGQLIGGALDTAADAGRFVGQSIHPDAVRKAGAKPTPNGSSLADTLSFKSTLGKVGNPDINEGLTQAIATMLPVPGLEGAGLAGAVVKTAVKAGLSAETSADTPEGRMVQRNAQAAFAGVTHLGIETVAIPLAKALIAARGIRTISEATPLEAAQDKLDRTFGSANTQAEREAQAATQQGGAGDATVPGGPEPTTAVAPGGTEEANPAPESIGGDAPSEAAGGGEGGAGADQGTPGHPTAQDANALIKEAGGEKLPEDQPPPVTPDGHIGVDPDTHGALKDAGLDAPFAPAQEHVPPLLSDDGTPERDPVLFKEESPDGGSRVVGSMGREDMNRFLQEATAIGEHPESIDTDSTHPSGQMTLRPLGNSDDAASMVRALVDRMPGDPRPITNADLMGAAKEWGFDRPEDAAILGSILSNKVEDLPQAVMAGRRMTRIIADNMRSLQGTDWTSVPDGDPRWEQALSAYHNGYSWMQMFRDTKTALGRSLQALQEGMAGQAAGDSFSMPWTKVKPVVDTVPPQPVPDFQTYLKNFNKWDPDTLQPYPPGQAPPLPRTAQEFQDALDLFSAADKYGPEALNSFWQGQTFTPGAWKALGSSLANWYTGAIVSRLSTFARDAVGPMILGAMETAERAAGSVVQAPVNAAREALGSQLVRSSNASMRALGQSVIGDSSQVASEMAAAGDTVKAYFQTFGDVRDASKAALWTLRNGESRLGGGAPYNYSAHQLPQAIIDAASKGWLDSKVYELSNAINLFPSAVHALHGGLNEFALSLAYLGNIKLQAVTYGRTLGLEGDALQSYVKDAVMSSRDPLTGMAQDQNALLAAQRTTFTKPVVDDNSGALAKGAYKVMNTIQNEIPGGRLIVPILKVPANGLGEQLRRIPVLNLMFKETASDLAGDNGQLAQAGSYGRMMMGGSVLAGGMMLAQRGLITGAGPHDAKDRSDWEAAGFQPYSFKGPDGQWHSYSKLDVVGGMLGLMGNLYDTTVYHPAEDPGLYQRTIGAVSAIAEYMKDQGAMKGISDFLDFGGDPGQDSNKANRLIEGVASGFVPGFLQAARDAIDPDRRTVRSVGDAMLNAIPMASKYLDPVRNLFGQVVHVPQGTALLPVTTSEVNPNGPQSDVLNEVHRLFVSSGSVPGPLSPSLPGGHMDQRDIPLEDGRSLYDAKMRYRAVTTDDNGDHIEQALRNTIQSEPYQAGFDGTQHGEPTDPTGRSNRASMLSKVFQDFDSRSRTAVAQASPIAARYMAVGLVKRLAPPGMNAYTTPQLVHNEALLNHLLAATDNPPISSYEETLRGGQ